MKLSASKIIILLLFSSLLLACDKDYPAPEGTLKIKIDIPKEYEQNAFIEIRPAENISVIIHKIKVGSKKEIEIELNNGNYQVMLYSHSSLTGSGFFMDTQDLQISQGKTTEITLRKQ